MPTNESERERLVLRERLAEVVGSETAGLLMELIPPSRWDELATKDDLNALAATMATKEDLRQTADLLRKETQADLKEMRGELKEGLGSLLARSADQQARFSAEIAGQHRTTMLALLGVFVAVMASFLAPLLTSIFA